MNRTIKTKLAAGAIGVIGMVSNCFAADNPELVKQAENDIEFSISIDVMSCYASRGQINTDHAVVQPTVSASSKGFGFEVWGNYNLAHSDEPSRNFSEINFIPSYNSSVVGLDLSVGLIDYEFPNTYSPAMHELFLKVAYPNEYLTPITEVYWDFDEADGVYALGALEHTLEVTQELNITGGFSTGWGSKNYNKYFFEQEKNAFNDGNLYLSATYAVTENLELGAQCFYTWLWDSDIKDSAKDIYTDTKKFVYGATVSYSF